MDPSPSQEPPSPPKLQQSVIILQRGFLTASNMAEFHDTWNLSLLSSKEHIKTAKLNLAKLNSAKLNSAKLNSAKLNLANFNLAKLNSAKLNLAKLTK